MNSACSSYKFFQKSFNWRCNCDREVPEEMVQNSLQVCGLSNALDGTEDDALCAEGMDSILEAQYYEADDDIELLLWRN